MKKFKKWIKRRRWKRYVKLQTQLTILESLDCIGRYLEHDGRIHYNPYGKQFQGVVAGLRFCEKEVRKEIEELWERSGEL